jgi:hypothetical protein
MATSIESPAGQVVRSWVPHELADQLKSTARTERRSLSAVIRLALEDQLRERDGTQR